MRIVEAGLPGTHILEDDDGEAIVLESGCPAIRIPDGTYDGNTFTNCWWTRLGREQS